MKQKTAIALFLITTTVNALAQPGTPADRKLDSIVERAAASITKDGPWTALSVGVVKGGQLYLYNYGSTGRNSNQVPTVHTLYEIGSITKTFSGILLAHAVLEKKVKLDDDIRQYLKGDYPNLAWQGKPIRLIHLVNLTSGLPNSLPDGPETFKGMSADSMPFAYVTLHDKYTKEQFFADLHGVKLDTLPGSFPKHSNAAGQLLGFILENVYKTSYEQLLKKYMLAPLGMDETYITVPENKLDLRATGYNEKGLIMPYITKDDPAAFGLKSTVADMTRYMAFQLDERDSAVNMTHQIAWGNPVFFSLGFNWFIGKTFDGKKRIRNDGTTFGFTTYCLLYPQLDFGVVLMTSECAPTGVIQNELGDAADSIYLKNFYSPAQLASDGFGFSLAINALLAEMDKKGFEHALEIAGEVKKDNAKFELQENELNAWGYALFRKGKKQEAVEIFKLNIGLYPQGYNTYDSMGDIYEQMGNRELAIKNYERSLELNPGNTNAIEHLKKLKK